METSDQHFAQDPETLEDFVLGRLDPAARAECEQHLRGCETCQQAVHVERIIAAGIMRAGREKLKERIGLLAGIPPRRRIPWPQVLSVAAVFLLLIGLGIYQGWFATRNAGSGDVAALERPSVQGKVDQAAPEARNEVAPSPQVTARPQEPSVKLREADQPARHEESEVVGRDEKKEYAPSPADRLGEAEGGAGKDIRGADASRRPIATTEGSKEFWANGTLMAETLSKKGADKEIAERPAMSKSLHTADMSRTGTDSFGHVTVEQRPLSKLPASLQNQSQLYHQQTVQTLVRQSQGETQLTLYPESPFDSTQIHYARVQQVAPDSLVVQIGSQQIGYKLPAGALRQAETETSKAKRR